MGGIVIGLCGGSGLRKIMFINSVPVPVLHGTRRVASTFGVSRGGGS